MNLLNRILAPAAAVALAAGIWASSAGAGQPAPDGEQIFRQRCALCHAATAGAPASAIAPNLAGVVGRKAASTAFAGYSPALKASNLTWTRQNLDQFLAAPTRKVPGTRMVIPVADPAQRAAVIRYLASRPGR